VGPTTTTGDGAVVGSSHSAEAAPNGSTLVLAGSDDEKDRRWTSIGRRAHRIIAVVCQDNKGVVVMLVLLLVGLLTAGVVNWKGRAPVETKKSSRNRSLLLAFIQLSFPTVILGTLSIPML